MASPPGPVESTPTAPNPSIIRTIFLGANGIRAGWRFLIFAVLVVFFEAQVRVGLRHVPTLGRMLKEAQNGTLTPSFTLVFESAALVVIILVCAIMAKIEKRPLGTYGIPLQGAFGKLFWQGVLWGLAAETAVIGLIYALRGFSFGTIALSGVVLVKCAVAWALAFVLVGLFEEFTFRGYPQFTLTTGMGFWPSAVLLSALFGGVHLDNSGEGWVGALSVMLFGLFACFTLRRTGNLWFAIGLHAAADYAETFIYSVPDSGLRATGHLLNSSFHGPRWLTGGTIGPEGSVMSFTVYLLSFVVFAWLYPAKKAGLRNGSVPPLQSLEHPVLTR